MDWKDIAQKVGKAAPLVGTLLGGPAGAAVGGLVAAALGTDNDPASVAQAMGNPEAAVKLRELELAHRTRLEELATEQAKAELLAVTANASDVNKTMQAEAAAEHWPTYTWRPAIGFAVALAVVGAVLTVFLAYGAAIFAQRAEGLQHLPGILAAVAGIIGVVSPILGIASWFRGRMQADPALPTVNKG